VGRDGVSALDGGETGEGQPRSGSDPSVSADEDAAVEPGGISCVPVAGGAVIVEWSVVDGVPYILVRRMS
jgi:hypothetical protein